MKAARRPFGLLEGLLCATAALALAVGAAGSATAQVDPSSDISSYTQEAPFQAWIETTAKEGNWPSQPTSNQGLTYARAVVVVDPDTGQAVVEFDGPDTGTPLAPATATATEGSLGGCYYPSTKPTYTNGQQGAVLCDSRGAQQVSLWFGGGADTVGTRTNGTDGVANTSINGLQIFTFPMVYNGTTWDRVRGTATGGMEVQSDALGTVSDAKVIDPDAATATMIALLRGMLEALNEISTNTAP